jgi:hypothetical protein
MRQNDIQKKAFFIFHNSYNLWLKQATFARLFGKHFATGAVFKLKH